MKKIIYFGLSFLIYLSLIACGKEEKESSQENQRLKHNNKQRLSKQLQGEKRLILRYNRWMERSQLSDFKGKKFI